MAQASQKQILGSSHYLRRVRESKANQTRTVKLPQKSADLDRVKIPDSLKKGN